VSDPQNTTDDRWGRLRDEASAAMVTSMLPLIDRPDDKDLAFNAIDAIVAVLKTVKVADREFVIHTSGAIIRSQR
jgi:hypothetical protein